MMVVAQKPDFNSESNAMLVIIRNQTLPVIVIWNYLDNKLIGETKGKMYFVTKVSPGLHYVIAKSENTTVIQMDFKAGKAYYLHQDIWPGFWRANTGLSVMSQIEAANAMNDCEYWEYNLKNTGEDLDPAKYEQGIKDYNADLKKNLIAYKSFLEHPGYNP
jgi:hypothetical protein